jgi:hypothetical protein
LLASLNTPNRILYGPPIAADVSALFVGARVVATLCGPRPRREGPRPRHANGATALTNYDNSATF